MEILAMLFSVSEMPIIDFDYKITMDNIYFCINRIWILIIIMNINYKLILMIFQIILYIKMLKVE